MKTDTKSEKNLDKSLKFSKKIIIFCIFFIVLYTIVQIFISYTLEVELSPTLTTCVYAFFGTELASCALIKIFEKKDKENELLEDSSIEGGDGLC